MDDVVPLPTPGGSHTMASSYDVRTIDKMNIHPINYAPTSVSYPTKTVKQYKPPSLSTVLTLQLGQAVTHIKSNGTRFLAIITKVIIFTIYGDPVYLIGGTPN